MRLASFLALFVTGLVGGGAAAQPAWPDACSWATVEADHPGVGGACSDALAAPELSNDLRVEALLLRGHWHHRARRYDDAADDYDAALALAPQHAKLLRLRGWVHFRQNEFDDAKRLAQLSAEIDPAQGATYALLANIAGVADDGDGAIAYFGKAVELDPKDALSRFKRLRWMLARNRATEALTETEVLLATPAKDLEKAPQIELDWVMVPIASATRIMHGRALVKLGRYQDAEAFYDRVVANEPTSFFSAARAQFLFELPTSALLPSRIGDAIESARAAVRLDEKSAYALTRLAYALELDRQHAEALAVSRQASAFENNATLRLRLAWQQGRLLRSQGRTDEASTIALKAIERAPRSEITERIVSDMAKRGYLQVPSEDATAESITAALRDAVTACMIDEKCGFF